MTKEYQTLLSGMILRVADGAFIPPDEANADYAAYLDWVAAGNTPDGDPAAANAAWDAYRAKAVQALSASDTTVLRCYENGVPLPKEWADYRKALRGIVGVTAGDATQPFPTQPAYPEGT